MKRIKIIGIILCIGLIILTGCGKKKVETKGVEKTKISSIYISTGDIGFESISIDQNGNEEDTIKLDNTSNINITVTPDSSDYEFTYSKEGIVKVESDGTLKPLKVGKTTVTAKATDGSNVESNKINIEVVE